jgi:hypothetical protein
MLRLTRFSDPQIPPYWEKTDAGQKHLDLYVSTGGGSSLHVER